VTMKNGVFWAVTPSEEPGASFIRVTKIGELGTTQAATSQRRTLRRNTWYFFAAYVGRFLSPWWRRRQVPPKRRFLQEPHGVTTQKTPFFIVILPTNLRLYIPCGLFRSKAYWKSWATYPRSKSLAFRRHEFPYFPFWSSQIITGSSSAEMRK
jgi:hypothetical protein